MELGWGGRGALPDGALEERKIEVVPGAERDTNCTFGEEH